MVPSTRRTNTLIYTRATCHLHHHRPPTPAPPTMCGRQRGRQHPTTAQRQLRPQQARARLSHSGATGSGKRLNARAIIAAGARASVISRSAARSALAHRDLVNTATVDGAGRYTDNNSTNDSSTDTDTAAAAVGSRPGYRQDGQHAHLHPATMSLTPSLTNAGPPTAVGARWPTASRLA